MNEHFPGELRRLALARAFATRPRAVLLDEPFSALDRKVKAALLDEVGAERAHVVGHDWGGALAWAIAAREPDRVETLTVLSTPSPAGMAAGMRSGDQLKHSWYMALFALPVLPVLFFRLFAQQVLERIGMPRDRAAHDAGRPLIWAAPATICDNPDLSPIATTVIDAATLELNDSAPGTIVVIDRAEHLAPETIAELTETAATAAAPC